MDSFTNERDQEMQNFANNLKLLNSKRDSLEFKMQPTEQVMPNLQNSSSSLDITGVSNQNLNNSNPNSKINQVLENPLNYL